MPYTTEDYVVISGFGDTVVNGDYYYQKTDANGYPVFRKNSTTYLKYLPKNMPYSYDEGYYIYRIYQIDGAIPIEKPKYRVNGTEFSAVTWTSMMEVTSGETTVGTTLYLEGSSSSSSIDSSSSSSSEEYSSSSSSSKNYSESSSSSS